jgi:hypothetical protein
VRSACDGLTPALLAASLIKRIGAGLREVDNDDSDESVAAVAVGGMSRVSRVGGAVKASNFASSLATSVSTVFSRREILRRDILFSKSIHKGEELQSRTYRQRKGPWAGVGHGADSYYYYCPLPVAALLPAETRANKSPRVSHSGGIGTKGWMSGSIVFCTFGRGRKPWMPCHCVAAAFR